MSPDSQRVIELGREVVASLEASASPSDPDLLTHWICHEIAGVLDQLANAPEDEALKSKARELVFAVWSRRSHWPSGWPPPAVAKRFNDISRDVAPWMLDRVESSDSVWLRRWIELRDICVEEMRLWWQMGLLETGVDAERGALATFAAGEQEETGLGEAEDLSLLRQQVELHDEATTWAQDAGVLDLSARKAFIEERLQELADRRASLTDEVVAGKDKESIKRSDIRDRLKGAAQDVGGAS